MDDFIDILDGYMIWYRDERIKLEYSMSITGKCRELGLMT